MQETQTTVALSAYGADTVTELGQAHFVPLVARAGASGVEIRRELFAGEVPDLGALRALIEANGLFSVYSAPHELWQADHRLAQPELSALLREAETLGARFLKVSLGHFGSASPLPALADALALSPVRLLVENDQTLHGGRPEPLAEFFAACAHEALPCAMTFDIGNWCWTGADPIAAAHTLGRHVAYVHCKGVTIADGRLRAIPLEAGGPWQRLFDHFAPALPRAIEFPLLGADLEAVTRGSLALIARA